jgi:hypothetical protein
VLLLASLCASAGARAEVTGGAPPPAAPEPGPPPPPVLGGGVPAGPEHPLRIVSVTISPLHLLSPILELTGEYRALDKLGVAVVAGAGKVSDSSGVTPISATALELGAQARYYVLGDFRHGMQLGAELLYLHLSDAHVSIDGEGVAVGPFVGYKFTADVGFTFDTQLGVEYVGARAMSSATGGSASGSRYIPLLNINVGWSF